MIIDSIIFFSSGYWDVSLHQVPSLNLCIQFKVPRHSPRWVSPFRHSRVKGCLPPHRDFSQAATSFLGIICRAIHHIHLMLSTHSLRLARLIPPIIEWMKSLYLLSCWKLNCERSERNAPSTPSLMPTVVSKQKTRLERDRFPISLPAEK